MKEWERMGAERHFLCTSTRIIEKFCQFGAIHYCFQHACTDSPPFCNIFWRKIKEDAKFTGISNSVDTRVWWNRELTLKCKLKCYLNPWITHRALALIKGNREPHEAKKKSFDLGGNRTHDLRIRSTVTLPTELRGRTEKVGDDTRVVCWLFGWEYFNDQSANSAK